MKYVYLILTLLLGTFTLRAAAAADDAKQSFKGGILLPYVFLSSDSEGFSAQKIGTGFYPRYAHGDDYAGVKIVNDRFSQNGWDRNGMHYSVVARDIETQTGMGYNLDLGVSTQGDHALVTTDSNWSRKWGENTGTELFINRDWVETQNALINGVSHTFAGGSVEQRLSPRVSVVGLAGLQAFSDGNVRQHGRAKLIYDVLPKHGINLQARYRAFHSNDSDVNNYYFNPNHYTEEMIAVGARRKIAGWSVNATAGLGLQHVEGASATGTKLLELGVVSPVAGSVFLRGNAGYSEAADVNGPNYESGYIQAQLVFAY